MRIMDVENVNELLQFECDAVMIDVAPERGYERERIRGALNAPLDEPGFESRVHELVPDRESLLIVYGRNWLDDQSRRAVGRLESAGYANVVRLAGGLGGWRGAGLETERGPRAAVLH